eukprot:403334699
MGVCKSKNQQPQPELIIKTITWQRDSHGLFDYECKDNERKQLKAIGSFSLMRNEVNIDVKYDEEDNQLEESKEEEIPQTQIAKIVEKNGGYWMFHSSTVEEEEEDLDKNPELKLWRIVKYCKVQNGNVSGYKLQPDDIIKLGRIRFKVREIQSPAYRKMLARQKAKSKKFNQVNNLTRNSGSVRIMKKKSNEVTETDNYQQEFGVAENDANFFLGGPLPSNVIVPKGKEVSAPLIIRETSQTSNGMPLCRICLSEDNDLINPLFSPCKCKGSMKHIHLTCLQEWLNSRKVTKETAISKTFFWKNLECELCKTLFPNHIKTGDNKNFFLRVIQYELPTFQEGEEPSYVVFESITSNTSKVIHVVNMLATNEIKLGRGHDADVRVTDISVSRLHAIIKKTQKGYFIMEDNHSKFGTLVMVRNPIPLQLNDANFIQAGRTMVEISIRRPIRLLDNCFCSPSQTNNNQSQRRSNSVKGGLTTINGVDFFPEEFLPDKKKIKKLKNESHFKLGTDKNQHTAFQSEVFDDQLPRIGIEDINDYELGQQLVQDMENILAMRSSINGSQVILPESQRARNFIADEDQEEFKSGSRLISGMQHDQDARVNIPDMSQVLQQQLQSMNHKKILRQSASEQNNQIENTQNLKKKKSKKEFLKTQQPTVRDSSKSRQKRSPNRQRSENRSSILRRQMPQNIDPQVGLLSIQSPKNDEQVENYNADQFQVKQFYGDNEEATNRNDQPTQRIGDLIIEEKFKKSKTQKQQDIKFQESNSNQRTLEPILARPKDFVFDSNELFFKKQNKNLMQKQQQDQVMDPYHKDQGLMVTSNNLNFNNSPDKHEDFQDFKQQMFSQKALFNQSKKGNAQRSTQDQYNSNKKYSDNTYIEEEKQQNKKILVLETLRDPIEEQLYQNQNTNLVPDSDNINPPPRKFLNLNTSEIQNHQISDLMIENIQEESFTNNDQQVKAILKTDKLQQQNYNNNFYEEIQEQQQFQSRQGNYLTNIPSQKSLGNFNHRDDLKKSDQNSSEVQNLQSNNQQIEESWQQNQLEYIVEEL